MALLDLQEGVFLGEEGENDHSYWEFINNSDAEYSDDSFSIGNLPNGVASWLSFSPSSLRSGLTQYTYQDADELKSCHDDNPNDGCEKGPLYDVGYPCNPYGYGVRNDYGYDEQEEEDEEDEEEFDGSDMDDELVPWSYSGKLRKQRMKKLGKRVFVKMSSSKRSPYLYVKPGCVHGKHGLGVKHSF